MLTWTQQDDGSHLSNTFGPEGFDTRPWQYQINRYGSAYRVGVLTFRGDKWKLIPQPPSFRSMAAAVEWCVRDEKSRVATGEATTRLQGATE